MRKITAKLLVLIAASCCAMQASAATPDEARQAIERAATSAREAAALKNQWTTATQALDEAKKAAASGDANKAIELAQKADALAKASIAQSKAESEAWKNAVIK